MVQWLNDWLKQIIMIILLATFVDLLLPNGLLQRYVKVIVSMFILLALLAPLLQVFRSPLPTEEIILPGQAEWDENKMASLEEVIEDGEKMRLARQENSREAASTQASEWLQNELQSAFPDQHFQTVELELSGEAPEWEIEQVYIHIKKGEVNENDDSKENEDRIADVAPVMIDVTMDEPTNTEHTPLNHHQDRRSLIQALHSLLRSWLDVNPEQVKLKFD